MNVDVEEMSNTELRRHYDALRRRVDNANPSAQHGRNRRKAAIRGRESLRGQLSAAWCEMHNRGMIR